MNQADERLLTSCSQISASTWSDALDELGVDGVIERALRIHKVDEDVEARIRMCQSFADGASAAGYLPASRPG